MRKNSIIDVWSGWSFWFSLLYMKDQKKALLNKTVEHAQLTKFQNFSGKKFNLSYSSKYISFSGSSSNIKRIHFFSSQLSRFNAFKLIYWNKSIQRANIIITTKWIPGTTPENNREITKKTNMRRKCVEWTSRFDMNVSPRVV